MSKTKQHYLKWEYVSEARFISFHKQITEALSFHPLSILEIGVGSGIVKNIVNSLNINYIGLDLHSSLAPDIVGTAIKLPFKGNSFDVIICCQVLEHLPFEDVHLVVSEIMRVSKAGCVISLPNALPYYYIDLQVPLLGKSFFQFSRNFLNFHLSKPYNPSHHWEIGRNGISVNHIKQLFSSYQFNILRSYRNPRYPYHHFFILKK